MDVNVIDVFNQKLNNLAFTNIFICTSAVKAAKTITFPASYNLDSNIGFKVVFVNGHDCGSATYNFTLNGKPVKMNNNGTYQNLPVVQSGTTYYSIQAGTVLDLYYDANQSAFIVVGNPVIMSNSTEKVLADGTKLWDFTKGKISSDLGLTSTNYGGKAATAGTADSAAKLTTARKTYVTLGTASTTTTRDWSGDTTIPVDGTLPVKNGGTGAATHTSNSVLVGNGTSAVKNVASANGAFYATAANGAPSFGTLPVAQGGTGGTTHTANSVLVGNGANAIDHVSSASGAMYSTGANVKPSFGTLPVAQGGTGLTTSTYKNAVVVGNASTATNALRTIRTGNGAFYATAQDGAPAFGTLPVAQGGTGQTDLDNVTVGNAKKLGDIAVQTTSIGGSATETGNHWSYVTKAKFTTTGGYIVYSNGLIIQWGKSYGGGSPTLISYSNTDYAVSLTYQRDHAYGDTLSVKTKTKTSFYIRSSNYNESESTGTDIACTWITIGY